MESTNYDNQKFKKQKTNNSINVDDLFTNKNDEIGEYRKLYYVFDEKYCLSLSTNSNIYMYLFHHIHLPSISNRLISYPSARNHSITLGRATSILSFDFFES